MIGSFLQTLTEVFTPLTASKSKKKDVGKKNGENKDRQSERLKSKPDLHLEETTVIEIDSE